MTNIIKRHQIPRISAPLLLSLLTPLALSYGASGCLEDEDYYTAPCDLDSDSDGDSDSDADGDADGDSDTTPHMVEGEDPTQPTSGHSGWKQANCLASDCHAGINAAVDKTYECGTCHGGNGASPCSQGNTSNCNACHNNEHSEQVAETEDECVACHR
ncbi:MAG: hypothetical protein QNJ97_00800 [Myxococcota bacterium]|nr:hypothetical protein [Myxococcota bacterium]